MEKCLNPPSTIEPRGEGNRWSESEAPIIVIHTRQEALTFIVSLRQTQDSYYSVFLNIGRLESSRIGVPTAVSDRTALNSILI